MEKVKLEVKRSHNLHVAKHSSQISESLPFFRTLVNTQKVKLVHRVRRGTCHYDFNGSGAIRHLSFTAWCNSTGFWSPKEKQKTEFLSEFPENGDVCTRCELAYKRRFPLTIS